jgi:hypothetical protein
MERATREEWAKRVERWKDSELTAKEFATELGINAHSLRWWSWQLGAERKAPSPKPRARSAKSTRTPGVVKSAAVTFVELPPPPPPATTSDALEIVLPTTIRIQVRPGFDDATLRRVLDVLEQRR